MEPRIYEFKVFLGMGTRFPRNNFWDLLGGQVLAMIGQWYPWQPLFSVAPKVPLKVYWNCLYLALDLRRHALHPTRRVINSKFVNTDRLISDIEFWMEVERFKYQAENAAECARSGNYTLEDENLLLEKARTIVKCYIDSDIPPRLQVC